MRNQTYAVAAIMTIAAASGVAALADDFVLDWYRVNGGGVMWSTGGDFELGGTIGQADANETVMSGGSFELVGGFWAVPPCWCLSDVNNDGFRDGLDVQAFIDCVLAGSGDCACADVETNGVLDVNDIATFVDDLLAGDECP